MTISHISQIIFFPQALLTLHRQRLLNSSIGGFVDGGVLPAGGHSQQSAAEGGSLLGLGEVDIRAEDVCQHGLPDLTDRTAATEDGLVDLDTAGLHAIAECIGNALKDGEAHVIAGGVHGQTDKRASCVNVVMRATFACQVGQEIHTRLAVLRLGGIAVIRVENIADPPLITGGRRKDAPHKVESAARMGKVVQSRAAGGVELVAGQEDGAAGTEGDAAVPVAQGVCAHGRAGVVPRARAENGVRQTVLGPQLTRGLVAFIEGGEHIHRDAADLAHLGRPALILHVEEEHTRGVGVFRGEHPRQLVGEVVLGQADLLGSREVLGLVLLDPEDLGGGEAGEGDIAREGGEGPEAVEVGGLFGAPSVVPEDGGADDLVLLVQHDQAVHLARDTDALDLGLTALGEGGEDLHGGLVPVRRILLAPVGIGSGNGVADAVLANDASLSVGQNALTGGRAEIDSNVVVHIRLPRRGYRSEQTPDTPVCR